MYDGCLFAMEFHNLNLLLAVLLLKIRDAYSSHLAHRHNNSSMRRIINGSPATLGQIPYIVLLEHVFCGGTILSETLVITAAHCCIDPASAQQKRTKALPSIAVLAGIADLSSQERSQRLETVPLLHPEFDFFQLG